jgi:hypothetical protein
MKTATVQAKFRVKVTVCDNVIGDTTFYLYSEDEVPATFAEHRLGTFWYTKTQLEMYNDEGNWVKY